jgi:hypothetical protein
MRTAAALLTAALGACGGLEVPQCMEALPRSEAEARAIVAEIRRELGDEARVEQVAGWFFVATDDSAASMRASRSTIERMVGHLYGEFFERRPAKPIRVYLFRGRESYEAYCRKTYEKPPATPFGFYLSRERKMVMNIATGTGTLAHELVHPLLGEDFPGVPTWFNEGFASLYEQSAPRDGRIVGLPNWRLPHLQKAQREGRAPGLEALLRTSSEAFYGDERGLHYAAARYLCYWLQERGWLARFYRDFRDGAARSPTGREVLERTVGRGLGELESEWRDFVQGLRLPD